MRELLSHKTNIDFVGKFPMTNAITAVFLLGLLGVIFFKGMDYGVDFRGGAEVQVKFNDNVSSEDLRDSLDHSGYENATVQTIGEKGSNEYLVKVQADEKNLNGLTNTLTLMLEKHFANKGAEIRKTDIVGPKAGKELRTSGFKAMFYAILAIMIYIGLRFDFKYSPGAILALTHDVIVILGIFAIFDVEFTLQTVAALLAVIGYSVNDTVVIYDRVRDHEELSPNKSIKEHINSAANETLSRTLLTSGTTLFISLSMYFWGGDSIHDFFGAISLGVIFGTYSSLFVAAPITIFFDKLKSDGNGGKLAMKTA